MSLEKQAPSLVLLVSRVVFQRAGHDHAVPAPVVRGQHTGLVPGTSLPLCVAVGGSAGAGWQGSFRYLPFHLVLQLSGACPTDMTWLGKPRKHQSPIMSHSWSRQGSLCLPQCPLIKPQPIRWAQPAWRMETELGASPFPNVA